MSSLSRSLEQAGRWFLHGRWLFSWQPHQDSGCHVFVPWSSSGKMPQHDGTCWVLRREMCCDRDDFLPPQIPKWCFIN